MSKLSRLLRRFSLLDILFLLLVFLPLNNLGSTFQLLAFAFIAFRYGPKDKFRFNGVFGFLKFFLVLSVICSLVFSGTLGSPFYTQSAIKIFTLLFIFLLFPFAKNYKINNSVIIFSVVFTLLTQLSYVLNISAIISIIETYYTTDYVNSSEVLALQGDGALGGLFRYGGIFRNPNQCGRIITFLYAIYLINGAKLNPASISMISLFFISVFLTGSRTALFILLLLTLVYFFVIEKRKMSKLIFVLPLFLLLIPFQNFDSRIFDFEEITESEDTSSVGAKFVFLDNYVNVTMQENKTKLILGTFNVDDIEYHFPTVRITKFDSEFGYLLHGLGVVGIALIILLIIYIFVVSEFKTRFLMIILVWGLTSTVLTNFRFSFLFFLVLSFYFNRKTKFS